MFEDKYLKEHHGFPYIAGLDIFVHDNVSKDGKAQEQNEKIAEYIITVADNIADGSMNSEQEKDALKESVSYVTVMYLHIKIKRKKEYNYILWQKIYLLHLKMMIVMK